MIPTVFIENAANILGDTENGLKGSDVAKQFSEYAFKFDVNIPYSSYPFPKDVPNKRTALEKNLKEFSPEQQFIIIKELCELEQFSGNAKVENLKIKLIKNYGHLNSEGNIVHEALVEETVHWLEKYPNVLSGYQSAINKYNNDIFERNVLDDLRLSLEILLKEIFENEKSLENQVSSLGTFIKGKGGSKELGNMFQKLVEYYSNYQNTHVKHNDLIIEEEIEFLLEITSSFMKHIIKIKNIP